MPNWLLKKKEVLFGRPQVQLEGGHHFQIPPTARLDRETSYKVATDLRAFATAPYFMTHGQRSAVRALTTQTLDDDDDDQMATSK